MKRRTPSHPETPLPTEAELAILSILWATGPATVREVHDALSAKQIGYTTVLKQMQVMSKRVSSSAASASAPTSTEPPSPKNRPSSS